MPFLDMHSPTRRSRSNSQSSEDTLMSWDDALTLDDGEPSRCRCRIENLPSSVSKSFDVSCLEALDDQLLDCPFDSFADDCYSRAVCEINAQYTGSTYWRKLPSPGVPVPHGMRKMASGSDIGFVSEPARTEPAAEPAALRRFESTKRVQFVRRGHLPSSGSS